MYVGLVLVKCDALGLPRMNRYPLVRDYYPTAKGVGLLS